jgi:hypothetical protein
MPIYRGNVGNLLQHWVLCEILQDLQHHAEHLTFIDAYSMAPFATERPRIDETADLFDYVREHLADGESPYEKAWHELQLAHSRSIGYPNSANFLVAAWLKQYSLLLCETDTATVHELREWTDGLTDAKRCVSKEVFAGDWRKRFSESLPASGDALLFSFDPYMVSRRRAANNPGAANVYPEDLDCLPGVVDALPDPLLMQISTYSANDGNSQEAVIDVVRSSLAGSGLEIVAVVRPLKKDLRDRNGQMMSLVLARNAPWAKSLAFLEGRFQRWQRGLAQRMS